MAVRHRSYCAARVQARWREAAATARLALTRAAFSRQVQHVGAGGEHPGWPTVRRLRGEVRRLLQEGSENSTLTPHY